MTASRRPGIAWWLLAIAATAVGSYGITLRDARPSGDAVPGMPWLDEVHFALGGVALVLGVWGFRRDVLARRPAVHRSVGLIYVAAVNVSGIAALLMAVYSLGGLIGHLGFGLLAVGWLLTTNVGWARIRARRVGDHRRWMVRSYALCCAAITLRIELGPLVAWTGSFERAYPIVAWLCWVPNLVFAEWWLRRRPVPAGGDRVQNSPSRT